MSDIADMNPPESGNKLVTVTPDLCSARFMLHCEPEVS